MIVKPQNRKAAIPTDAVEVLPEADLNPSPAAFGRLAATHSGAREGQYSRRRRFTVYHSRWEHLDFFFPSDPNIPAEDQLGDGVTGIYISYKTDNE